MPLRLLWDKIACQRTDAIVNPTNVNLQPSNSVSKDIFKLAGMKDMQEACRKLICCETGSIVLTEGFHLPARYVIHMAAPVWQDGGQGEEELLRAGCRSALNLAAEKKMESISLPLISVEEFGYPAERALSAVLSEVRAFLEHHEMLVNIVVHDPIFFGLTARQPESIARYIESRLVDGCATVYQAEPSKVIKTPAWLPVAGLIGKKVQRKLEDLLRQVDETFSESLMRLIDQKGRSDVEVYKRANIDRKLFSKIRSNRDYKPTKATALALAVALELSLDETKDLLARAGLALSPASKFDLVIEYFISEGNYDVYEINEALFYFEQPQLGG